MKDSLIAAVITISDRSFQGVYADQTGPAVCQLLSENQWQIIRTSLLPDEKTQIEKELLKCCDDLMIPLVITAGGTGFSPRDVTPEATRSVIEKEASGLVIAMVQASLTQTPHAMLSRQVAGIRGNSLIVNLPGSPAAACENLAILLPALPHAISLIRSEPDSEKGHHSK